MATETAVDVVMPQMGVSVSEGTITKWLKQQGEQIEADEPLLEISTDKVDTEVPSPASGTLTQILVQEGETVEVGTKLAQIGGAPADNGQAQAAPPEPATAAVEGETPTAEVVEEARPAEPEAAPESAPAPAEPPPSVKTGNTVRWDVSLASSVVVIEQPLSSELSASLAMSVLPRRIPC